MHRSLFLRSIGRHSFRKLKPPESVKNDFVRITQASQSFTTSNGQGCRGGDGDKPVLRSIQAEIVNALLYGERSTASHLLLDLGRGNRVLRAMDFVDILDYCANSPDPLFVMETWRTMVEKKVNINRRCYLLIIQSLCKGGYLEEAFNLMSSIGENPDIYPSPNMYNFFLKACVQIGSINHASKCLDLMEKQMVGKNVVTYMELLKLAVLQKNLCAVHDIWKECTKYYNLDVVSLRKFIKSFARLGDLNTAHAVLQCTLASTLQGGQAMVETAEWMLTTPNLDIPVPSSELNLEKYSKDNETYIPSLVGHFNDGDIREVQNDRMIWTKDRRMAVISLLLWSFNDVIHACAKIRNPWLAEKLVLQMQKLGLEPTRNTYDGLIRAVIGYRGVQEGLELLKEMQNKNLRPRDSTFGTISVHCSKVLELDLAESFLDQISSCRYTYPYNYFLQACSILNRPERAIRILAKMRQMKLQLDTRTYELLFSLFGNVNAPYEKGNMLSQLNTAKRISAIEADMRKNGIDHSYLTIRNMLRALGEEGMINDMIHYLRVAENQFSRTNKALGTPIYNTVLDYLVEARAGLLAVEMFKTMIACGYQPDAATYSIMMKCCAVNRDFRSACALLSLMIRDGFEPQLVAYTALIEILLKDKDFNGALNILDKARSEKIQLDVVLFNTILEAARKKQRLDLVELIVERMHKEKIHPDSSTCRHVFSAYVTGGFFSTAVEALQVLSMRMILADDHTLEGKRGAFEDLILADDLKAESRIVELYEDYKEYLVVGLLNLRWCAIMGYPISWWPDQSQWAKRLSNTCSSNWPK